MSKLFVDMWNSKAPKSKIIVALYDEGLTVSEVVQIFRKYSIKMSYNHVYNEVSKKYDNVRTEKSKGERVKLIAK